MNMCHGIRAVMENKIRLSFNVICQDEEELINQCLGHLTKIGSAVDGEYEIVIVDGGSKDKTVECIHRQMVVNPHIEFYQRAWPGSFGDQRQFNLEKSRGEWIMLMDVDDVLSDGIYSRINELMAAGPDVKVYCFPKVHLVGDIEHMNASAPKDPKRVLWRNLPEFSWSGEFEQFLYEATVVHQHPCSFNFPWIKYVPDISLVHFEGLKSAGVLIEKVKKRSKYKKSRFYGWSDERIEVMIKVRRSIDDQIRWKEGKVEACLISDRYPGLTFYHDVSKEL